MSLEKREALAKSNRGGPRKNSGGARPGAGRPRIHPLKPKSIMPPIELPAEPVIHTVAEVTAAADKIAPPAKPPELNNDDTLQLLKDIAFGRVEASAIQVRAAVAAVQYEHTKRADGGKKESQQKDAEKVAGKFVRNKAPKLVANGGSLVKDDGEE